MQKKEKGDTLKEKPSQHFLKQITEVRPDTQKKPNNEKPDCYYEIDHVHGFAGDRNKSMLHFGKDENEIVFSCAALGVVQDLKTRKQKFFGGKEKDKDADKYQKEWPYHQDDITTIDIAGGQARNIVASGECGKMSTIHIWDTNTMSSIANFSLGPKAKGCAALSISPCQKYVAAVDQSNDHIMYIYNIHRQKMLMQLSAGSDAIYQIQWSQKPNDLKFVAVTSRSLQFWNPADSSKKLFRNGTFGAKFQQTKMNSATFDEDGICYSSGANGGIHLWDQKQDLQLVIKAHAGECTQVRCHQGILASVGKDDMCSIFTAKGGEYEFVRQVNLEQYYQASALDILNNKILIGHDNGTIQTLNVDGTGREVINVAHHDGESWGLFVLEEEGTFLTCGDDNKIFEFSIKDKKLVKQGKVFDVALNDGKPYQVKKDKSTASTLSSTPVHAQARGITYSKKHKHVAVSNNYGDITILDYNDFNKKITQLMHPKEWCETLMYSPNQEMLAVGGHDDTIYIYKISDSGEYTHYWTISFIHSSAILGMDWTRDSKYLRAVDQAYAKKFYNVETKEVVGDGNSTLVDAALWATSTCKLGWEVAGVFPEGYDGTDINCVDASEDRQYLCAGDDFGTVFVYKFPVLNNSQPCRRLTGHSEHVPRVRFYNSDEVDRFMISAGGMDRTYIQWREVPALEEEEKD